LVLRCLPASELPGGVGVTSATAIPARRTRGLVPVHVAGVACCPAGTSVYGGGGAFTKANGELIGGLSTSAPAFDGNGWHVTGIGPGGDTLTVTARCVARPRVVTGDAGAVDGQGPGTEDRLGQSDRSAPAGARNLRSGGGSVKTLGVS
jgi:hypothetical protein